ncbi:MAG: FtsX-like permease family protein [Patescibacteria group bacterium]
MGKTFRLKDVTFRVIGILDKEGLGPGGIDQDNGIIIPITVAQKQLLGINYYAFITVQSKDVYSIDFAKERVSSVLRQNHKITDSAKDDFTIHTQQDALTLLGSITSIMTLFLTAIASISLVVGGIGIMNIMLVSVVERTKEIGLRKALGATNRDIMQQFLIESILLTFIGGVVGVLVGSFLTGVVYLVLVKFTTIA